MSHVTGGVGEFVGGGRMYSESEGWKEQKSYPTLSAHFSEKEKEPQRRVLPKDCGEAEASPSTWQ